MPRLIAIVGHKKEYNKYIGNIKCIDREHCILINREDRVRGMRFTSYIRLIGAEQLEDYHKIMAYISTGIDYD